MIGRFDSARQSWGHWVVAFFRELHRWLASQSSSEAGCRVHLSLEQQSGWSRPMITASV